jgi:hypothetical protein
MKLKIKQLYLFYPVALQQMSGISRVIVEFLCNTDKQKLDAQDWKLIIIQNIRYKNAISYTNLPKLHSYI